MVNDKTPDSDAVASIDVAEEDLEQEEGSEPTDEEGGEKGKGRRSRKRPSNPKNATELLGEYLVYQATRAAAKLRQSLIGKIGVEVSGIKKNFLIDWTGDELVTSESDDLDNVDCRIRISEDDLLEIARGKLNPQVAMLSHKIHVAGNLNFAMYFFNLFATRVR
jgi:hypothetical protein